MGRETIRSIAFRPDGKMLATCTHYDITLWDATSLKKLLVIEDAHAHSITFSADGAKLVSGGDGIKVWAIKEIDPRVWRLST